MLLLAVTRCWAQRADGGPLITQEADLPVSRFNRGIPYKKGRDKSYKKKSTKPWEQWGVLTRFDWFIEALGSHVGDEEKVVEFDHFNRDGYPRSMWCYLHQIQHCIDLMARFEPDPKGRVVVFAGQDRPWLSQNPEIRASVYELARWFEGVRFESKDVPDPRVGTAVMGLSEHYYRGNEQAMFDAINNATTRKTRLAFGAWGEFWKMLDESEPRMRLENWVSKNPWVERLHVARQDWYPTVATSQFLIQPLGNSMQTPKMVEALLVLTVPVVESVPCHDDLLNEGWPIVVVHNWDEVTPAFLKRKWIELEPRLVDFRRDFLLGDGFYNYLASMPTSL